MNAKTFALVYGTETLRFSPMGNETVVVDHLFPNGLVGRPGVAIFGKVMSLADARARYLAAIKSGWTKA